MCIHPFIQYGHFCLWMNFPCCHTMPVSPKLWKVDPCPLTLLLQEYHFSNIPLFLQWSFPQFMCKNKHKNHFTPHYPSETFPFPCSLCIKLLINLGYIHSPQILSSPSVYSSEALATTSQYCSCQIYQNTSFCHQLYSKS
jgi:hypothetical protein